MQKTRLDTRKSGFTLVWQYKLEPSNPMASLAQISYGFLIQEFSHYVCCSCCLQQSLGRDEALSGMPKDELRECDESFSETNLKSLSAQSVGSALKISHLRHLSLLFLT